MVPIEKPGASTADGTASSPPGTNADAAASAHLEEPGGKQASRWTGELTSGLNQGFQLSLGGIFSDGSNFQNSGTLDLNNVLEDGDILRFFGIVHSDTGSSRRDTILNLNYIKPLAESENSKLTGTVGYHVWQFPSVIKDNLWMNVLDTGLVWTRGGPVGLLLDANVKTLLNGPTSRDTGGQAYYVQGLFLHTLVERSSLSISMTHGPSYAYAQNILGVDGSRVLRYEVGLKLQRGNWGIETIYRPQFALQSGIPENQFWGFDVFYLFD
jgi:hypothetical protein